MQLIQVEADMYWDSVLVKQCTKGCAVSYRRRCVVFQRICSFCTLVLEPDPWNMKTPILTDKVQCAVHAKQLGFRGRSHGKYAGQFKVKELRSQQNTSPVWLWCTIYYKIYQHSFSIICRRWNSINNQSTCWSRLATYMAGVIQTNQSG